MCECLRVHLYTMGAPVPRKARRGCQFRELELQVAVCRYMSAGI